MFLFVSVSEETNENQKSFVVVHLRWSCLAFIPCSYNYRCVQTSSTNERAVNLERHKWNWEVYFQMIRLSLSRVMAWGQTLMKLWRNDNGKNGEQYTLVGMCQVHQKTLYGQYDFKRRQIRWGTNLQNQLLRIFACFEHKQWHSTIVKPFVFTRLFPVLLLLPVLTNIH